MTMLYSQATTAKIGRHESWYSTSPGSSPRYPALTLGSPVNRWGLLVLVIIFFLSVQIIIQVVFYLWSKFRRTASASASDDIPAEENSSTDIDSGSSTWPYRDDIGPDVPTTTDPTTGAHQIQPRLNDDPYVAGVTSLISLEDAEAFRPAPSPVANGGEVRKLIAQLHSIINEPEGEDSTKKERQDVVKKQIARIVLADPRYAIVSPLGPPPAYSDAIAN